MDLYRWTEQRASRRRLRNLREDLPETLQLHHLPLKEVLQMGQQVHVWSCRLRRQDQCHRQDVTNDEYNLHQSQIDGPRRRPQPGVRYVHPTQRGSGTGNHCLYHLGSDL